MAGDCSCVACGSSRVPVIPSARVVEPHHSDAGQFHQVRISAIRAVVISVRNGPIHSRIVYPEHVPKGAQLFFGWSHAAPLWAYAHGHIAPQAHLLWYSRDPLTC